MALQKPLSISGGSRRFDQLKIERGGSLLQQVHLLLAVSLLVVLQTLVDVLVSPLEQPVDQTSELMAMAVIALGAPSLLRRRRYWAPR